MVERDGRWRYFLDGERDLPLCLKYDLKPLWAPLKALLGVDATGAAIVVALYEAFLMGRSVSYSRHRAHYTVPARYKQTIWTYERVTAAVDALDAAGWIYHRRQAPGGRGCQSAMEAKPALIALVANVIAGSPKLELLIPRETIILRDENGRLQDYPDRQKLDRMRSKVERFNEVICGTEILSADGNNLASPMARIFNRDFSRGGRFFPRGMSYQNAPRHERPSITIDGAPSTEWDYKALHPTALYAEAGAPMPADCYDVGDRWPRPLAKKAVLTCINAATHGQALGSIAHSDEMADHLAERGCDQAEAERETGALIRALKRKNRPIAPLFGKDAGARLMRMDSDMAEAVMSNLILGKGIPTLPVHDSFLVPASKSGELQEAMMQAAHAKGLREIRIEAK